MRPILAVCMPVSMRSTGACESPVGVSARIALALHNIAMPKARHVNRAAARDIVIMITLLLIRTMYSQFVF